jgi:hypothetical protein
MSYLPQIVYRLNIWMNYDCDDQIINENYQFESKIVNNEIIITHQNTNTIVAKVYKNLTYNLSKLSDTLDNFQLTQYTNSLVVRIMSTL